MRPELTPETGSPSQGKQAPARRRAWLHTPDEPETLWRVVEVVAVARDDGDGAARPTVDDGATLTERLLVRIFLEKRRQPPAQTCFSIFDCLWLISAGDPCSELWKCAIPTIRKGVTKTV